MATNEILVDTARNLDGIDNKTVCFYEQGSFSSLL